MNFSDKLNECSDFSCIFKLVKSAVERTIGKRRVGLSLGLTDLPNYIGAFHQLGSNFIIMNKKLLDKIVRSGNRRLINAYIFHVLLHEYIHSLGFVNEQETQILTHEITKEVLGSDHPSTRIARYGLGSVFSNIADLEDYEPETLRGIEIVTNFENENLSYIG